jgi:atypical dual specificity phosphatase
MDWITENIAIGDYREAQDKELLREAGFASVLGLISTLADKSPTEMGLKRIEIVTLLDGAGNDPALFRRAVDTLAELVSLTPPVFVHCRAGWSRSPAVVAGYLIITRGLQATQALGEVSAKRPGSMAPELQVLLADLETSIRKRV